MYQYEFKLSNGDETHTVYCTAPNSGWALLQVMSKYSEHDGFLIDIEGHAKVYPAHYFETEIDASGMTEDAADYLAECLGQPMPVLI